MEILKPQGYAVWLLDAVIAWKRGKTWIKLGPILRKPIGHVKRARWLSVGKSASSRGRDTDTKENRVKSCLALTARASITGQKLPDTVVCPNGAWFRDTAIPGMGKNRLVAPIRT